MDRTWHLLHCRQVLYHLSHLGSSLWGGKTISQIKKGCLLWLFSISSQLWRPPGNELCCPSFSEHQTDNGVIECLQRFGLFVEMTSRPSRTPEEVASQSVSKHTGSVSPEVHC